MPRKQRLRRPGALADLQPLRILTQIVFLQIAYYVGAAVLIIFTALVAGRALSLGLLFDWQTIRADTTVGWMLGLVWMLNSLISYVRSISVVNFAKVLTAYLGLSLSSFLWRARSSSPILL
jgi:hypothetical protein